MSFAEAPAKRPLHIPHQLSFSFKCSTVNGQGRAADGVSLGHRQNPIRYGMAVTNKMPDQLAVTVS